MSLIINERAIILFYSDDMPRAFGLTDKHKVEKYLQLKLRHAFGDDSITVKIADKTQNDCFGFTLECPDTITPSQLNRILHESFGTSSLGAMHIQPDGTGPAESSGRAVISLYTKSCVAAATCAAKNDSALFAHAASQTGL